MRGVLGFWGVDLLEAVVEAVCDLWGSPSPCVAIFRLLLSVIEVSEKKDLGYHPELERIQNLRERLVVGRALLMMGRRCCI
jgi:hypothetical protein